MEGSEKVLKNYVHRLSFGVRDAVMAARYGFNARNIWTFWKGLALAWLIWSFFTYLGFHAAGDSISGRFASSVLCPLPDALFSESVPALILLSAGTLFALFIFLTTSLKVSKLTFEQLRGDQFYSERDARKFCMSNWKPLVLTPLTLTAGILLGLAALLVPGLLGRIPVAGPVLAALLAVPSWTLALFIVFALVVLVLSVFLVPAIVASTGGDTFECLFEVFSVAASKPFRIIRAALAGIAMRLLGLVLFVVFAWGSVSIAGLMIDITSGFSGTGSTIESGLSRAAPEVIPFYSSIFSPVASTAGNEGSWSGLPAVILSASGVFILLIIAAYWFSSCSAMWTIIYIGARHSRDGEDLLLRAEEEEYREFRRVYGSTDHAGDRPGK